MTSETRREALNHIHNMEAEMKAEQEKVIGTQRDQRLKISKAFR